MKETSIDRLLGIMRRLRGPGGCPWDREQTLDSLKSNLIEETCEVIDTIESDEENGIAKIAARMRTFLPQFDQPSMP